MNILKNALGVASKVPADPAKEAERADLAAKMKQHEAAKAVLAILREGKDTRTKHARRAIRSAE